MTDLMENGKCSSRVIDEVATTPDTLTSRGGLSFFVRYLRNIGLAPHLQRLFGSIRKSAKGQPWGRYSSSFSAFSWTAQVAIWRHLHIEELWLKSGHPPHFAWA